MKIFVTAKPNSKENKVEALLDPSHLKVWIKDPAQEGKANLAVVREVANHFNVSKSSVEIVSGFKSKNKILTVNKL